MVDWGSVLSYGIRFWFLFIFIFCESFLNLIDVVKRSSILKVFNVNDISNFIFRSPCILVSQVESRSFISLSDDIWLNSINVDFLLFRLKLKLESKLGTNLWFWFKFNLSFVFSDQQFRDHKSQTYSVRVFVTGLSYEPKELEELLLVCFAYPRTSVLYLYLQELIVFYRNCDFDGALSRKLDCIRLQIDQYLHDSLLIMIDNWIMSLSPIFVETNVLRF